MRKVIAIVAGETSGDNLGASLIAAIKARDPSIHFVGVGGPNMKAQGCEILYDMERIGLLGIDGLLTKLRDILAIRKHLHKYFTDNPPALFVGIDVPDFNMTLEKKLKASGIPVLHYVSPTVWAWRGYRIKKIRQSVDHMLTLYPFEATYYEKQSIPVTYVGHPMADEIEQPNKQLARQALSLNYQENDTIIALLPGSRSSEIKRLASIFMQTAQLLYAKNKNVKFILPFANEYVKNCFETCVDTLPDVPIDFMVGNARRAMEAADVVILASGTAALEAALLQRPHVVVYRVSKLMHWILEHTRHVDYYSMPNHLLPTPKVPELMQSEATPENIVAAVENYLQHPQQVAQLAKEFASIHAQLRLDGSAKAAEVAISMMRHDG